MNRFLRISSVVIGILALAAIGWVVLVLFVFHGARRQVPAPVYSPDGSKIIVPIVNSNKDDYSSYLLVYFEIQDAQSRRILFQVQTRASDRMRWSINWVDNHTVKLDSSDIGSYCWTEVDVGRWREDKCR